MPFGHGSKAKVLVNGWDITGFLNSIEIPSSADTADVTTLGLTSKAYVLGPRDATISADGFYDGAASAIDAIMATVFGAASPSVWSHFPDGDTLGKRAIGVEGNQTAYNISTVVSDAQKITISVQSNRATESGISLHPLQIESATSNGTGVDNLAASTLGGVGYLQVTGATGSATVKVQHSTDNSIWSDLITFAAVTGRATERKSVTGTVNRYTRAQWTVTTNVTFTLHFARY